MIIRETKTRTVFLDSTDIRQAIIMYMKQRGEKEISDKHIELKPESIAATIMITEELNPEQ